MESAVFLAEQGFVATFEPTAPKKGPDILAEREGIPYFVEIREAGFSWDENRIHSISKKIFAKLNSVPSSYSVAFTIGDGYIANSAQLKAAIAVVVDALELLKENKLRNATLYYAHPNGKLLNPGGDLADSRGVMLSGRGKQYQEIVDKADFVARFRHLGKEQTGTPATLSRKLKFPPEPVKTHERLKHILTRIFWISASRALMRAAALALHQSSLPANVTHPPMLSRRPAWTFSNSSLAM